MRAKPIRTFLYSLLLGLLCLNPLAGQDDIQHDEPVELRSFDKEKLQDYRDNRSYQYEPVTAVQEGAFQRFLRRIQEWFFRMIGSGTASTIWDILWRLVLVAAFVLFIVKIFGIETQSLFRPAQAKKTDAYKIDEESLDQINFEEEIQKAVQQKQWRLAIRLTYLYALKHLADTERLIVKKGKTNHEYLYELSAGSLKENFSQLSFLFDYTWYGHFEANQSMASKADDYLRDIVSSKEKQA